MKDLLRWFSSVGRHKTYRRRGAAGAAVISLLVVSGLGRCIWESKHELEQAQAASKAKRPLDEVTHYRRAARWYFPGNPWVDHALSSLRSIGKGAEKADDEDLALFAWRAIRGSVLASRSIYTHHQPQLSEANRHIASLMAAYKPRPAMDRGKTKKRLRQEHLSLLEDAEKRPRRSFVLLALFGFFLWIACVYALIGKAFTTSRHTKILGFGAASGFLLFVLSLLYA